VFDVGGGTIAHDGYSRDVVFARILNVDLFLDGSDPSFGALVSKVLK
jgi:hypothetical protein